MHDEWKQTKNSPGEAYERLLAIVEILRKECPWDKEQDHHSLRPCLIEEAYEAADAIDKEDRENLREEMGDVLLQTVFHSVLAREEGWFTATDVINEVCDKMIRRHPHVFSKEPGEEVDKVPEKWENIKVGEHLGETDLDRLKGVPHALPALIRSDKVQKRAAQCGYIWEDVSRTWEQVAEKSGDFAEGVPEGTTEDLEATIGDMLFSLVRAIASLGISSERALELATERFIEEFAKETRDFEGNSSDKVAPHGE